MSTTSLLFDDKHWRKLGAEDGQRNVPRTPAGDSPARSMLETAWQEELRVLRAGLLEQLTQLDESRATARRQLHELGAQAAADQRQAQNLTMLVERDHQLTIKRGLIWDGYLEAVETLTLRAQECDALWRCANERRRDRLLTLTPTGFTVPASLLIAPADPFA